jgi:hypothetical protein
MGVSKREVRASGASWHGAMTPGWLVKPPGTRHPGCAALQQEVAQREVLQRLRLKLVVQHAWRGVRRVCCGEQSFVKHDEALKHCQ